MADFPFVGGFCPESGTLRLGVLIRECGGCQRSALGKTVETDVAIWEAGCGPDRQVPFCPVITCCNENVEIAAAGAAVGGALERRPVRGISAWTATHRSIQVETVTKDRSVHANFSGIDVNVAAGAVEADAGVGITGSQTNCKVRIQAVVHSEGKASGVDVIAGCVGSTVDGGELAQTRQPDAPAILGSGSEDRRSSFAFRTCHPGKT